MFIVRLVWVVVFAALVVPYSAFCEEKPNYAVSDLAWVNETFLSNQRQIIDELSRRHFGTPIRGDASDLGTLQRFIDKAVIKRDDTATLQALGVVLGDVFVSQNENLVWQVLEDDLGKSHVVCIKNTHYCLFPVTMLSRRYEVGLSPNVKTIYSKALEDIEAHQPKRPFQD